MRRLFSTTAILAILALSLEQHRIPPKSQKFPNPTRWAKPPGMASNSMAGPPPAASRTTCSSSPPPTANSL